MSTAILRFAGRTLNRALRRVGFELRRVTADPRLDFLGALRRLGRPLREVRTVIDVGASDGRWSKTAMRIIPDARYMLVEANAVHASALSELTRVHPNVSFTIAAAADIDGQVYFDGSDPFGGLASHEPRRDDSAVASRTLDSLVESHDLSGPFLVKLDTHGFEVPILNGAPEVLKHASLVVIEAYNFRIEPDALRFHELCVFMEERGFSVLDISDILHRPNDGALWQFDLYFVPNSSPEFEFNSYGLQASTGVSRAEGSAQSD